MHVECALFRCVLPLFDEVKWDMTDLAKARRLRYVTVDILPLRALLLALFLVFGILCGYVLSGRCGAELSEELRRYLDAYVAGAAERSLTGEAVFRTLVCYLRASVIAFLLGFASIGVIALPLLFAAQGFVLSFSLFSFALALGRESFVLLPAIFALRLLFVLPCTFLTGTAALEKSYSLAAFTLGGGKRVRPVSYPASYWYRFAVCCVCLLLGCVLELWLLPLFLAA